MNTVEAGGTVPINDVIDLFNEAFRELKEVDHLTVEMISMQQVQGFSDTDIQNNPRLNFNLGKLTLGKKWLNASRAFIEAHGVEFDEDIMNFLAKPNTDN